MVSLLDSLSNRRATATTGVTGFYHFATTRVLTAGASYAVGVAGLPLSFTDPNGQKTSITTYDSMLRATQQNDPDGGEVKATYSPTTITVNGYQSSSSDADTEVQFDGYGRVSRIAVANGQSSNPWYQQDICYTVMEMLVSSPIVIRVRDSARARSAQSQGPPTRMTFSDA